MGKAPETNSGRPANRLAGEASLYLRQHAHNPVDWNPWDEQALDRARREDRPIFLSVGYASCHWCHVMEREVFEDDEVAALLNEGFVCIKLDREERPDLDAAYMEALQALTGGGGWPMSLFLTPDLRPFYGETYVPRERFLALASRLLQVFAEQRDQVEGQAALLYRRVAADPEISVGAEVKPALLEQATAQSRHYFDPVWGGFRGRMKFPTPPRWAFLLHRLRRTGDPRVEAMVRTTLDAICSGGICDQVGGGFHRYTVEETWLVPHFEKMLYDNAQLAGLLAEASLALGAPRYEGAARAALDFLLRDMQQPAGGFYASFDADSGGVEGSFYLWTPQEVEAVAGPSDGPPLAALLGVTPGGNFEGRSIPTRRADPAQVARGFGRQDSEVAGLLERWTEPLRLARQAREAPALDRKVVTSWNGLCVSAMARAGALWREPRYLRAAEAAADALWRTHRRQDGRLQRCSNDGVPAEEGVLGDYAFFAQGLLDLFDAGQQAQHLRRALSLLDHAVERFAHPEAGFYQTPEDHPAPMGRRVELLDSVRPSASAAMVQALLRAAALTGREDHHQRAARAIGTFSPWMRRFGLEMAAWLDAADLLLGPLYLVVVAGDPGAGDTAALVKAFRALHPHHALLATVPAAGPDPGTATLLPTTAGKVALHGRATAYVCQHGACQAPVHTPEELGVALFGLLLPAT